MGDLKDQVSELVKELKKERDELRVKISLAKLEAQDEWQDLEKKLHKLEARAREIGGATAEASKDVGAAAVLLGEEIRKGLKAIARRF